MTYIQLNAILNPADGLVVYCTDCGSNGIGALSMAMGGAWFTLSASCINLPPAASTNVPSPTQIIWNWNPVSGAAGYKWNTTNDYNTATDMGTATTKTEVGLNPNTIYTRYVWSYRACGNSPALTMNQMTAPSPTCGQPITDIRDGKTYSTVEIGTQCWMAQNLNIGTKINGSDDQTDNSIIEKYCYNNNDANCTIYGGLYQWAEIVQYINGATNTTSWNPIPTGNVRGICPSGWHIPTDAEWTILTTYLGGESIAGGEMKEAGTVHWLSPNTGATNSSGFSALPSGYRSLNGNFSSLSGYTYFWSTQYESTTSWDRALSAYAVIVYRNSDDKTYGFSVRCIQD